MSCQLLSRFAFGCALTIIAAAASAADTNPLNDRFSINLGAYFMSSDTDIRVDDADGLDLGTNIDLEDTFGFDDESVFRLEGAWRFFPRHKLRLMYFASNRRSHDELEEDIDFNGTTFPVAAEVNAKFDFDIIELAYEYEFLHRDNLELGVSIGIHNVGVKMALDASISAGGAGASGSLHEDVDTDAPLPVVGLRGTWRMGGNFYLQAHAQYFQLKFDAYDGSLQDYQAGVLWQFTPHFGVGAAYNLFDTTVKVDDGGHFIGRLDWAYDGAQVYVRAAF